MEAHNQEDPIPEEAACKVLVVDDHRLMRDGLRILLSSIPNITVIAEAENGHDAITLCRSSQPAIVLMDLNLPELDGIEAIRQIHRRFPEIRVLVLTATATEASAAAALNAGAFGYILKRSSSQNLIKAIDTVLQGRLYLDPALDSLQISSLMISAAQSGRYKITRALTAREKQILRLIAQGNRNRDIAGKLIISLKTVEAHRLSLMQKLGAHNAAELTRWAYRLGMLGSDIFL